MRHTWQLSMIARAISAAALVLAAGSPVAAAQSDSSSHAFRPTHLLRTTDGSVVLGQLIDSTADSVRLLTASGRFNVRSANLAELRSIDVRDLHDNEYWFPDPNRTRLFFAPTARMLRTGEGYFNDTWLFFLGTSVGATDRVTLGGGMSVLPTGDPSYNVFYLTPKIGLYSHEDLDVAAGALVGFAGHASGSAGILYGVVTKGSPNASVTIGGGAPYTSHDGLTGPLLMAGGNIRISRRSALVSENYLTTSRSAVWVPMYGIRFFGEKLSVDLAFLNVISMGGGSHTSVVFPGFPWLSFATKF